MRRYPQHWVNVFEIKDLERRTDNIEKIAKKEFDQWSSKTKEWFLHNVLMTKLSISSIAEDSEIYSDVYNICFRSITKLNTVEAILKDYVKIEYPAVEGEEY